MIKFRKISTKLGAVYTAIFMVVTLSTLTATYALISEQVKSIVGKELAASGSVFSRLLDNRAAEIQSDVALQIRDFGFRSAVSSDDEPTINSALATLRKRLQVEALALVDIDGLAISQVGDQLPLDTLSTIIVTAGDAPQSRQKPGVVFLGETAVLTGYAPIMAPDVIGWVVFGDFIDQSELEELESLSSIALKAKIGRSDQPAAQDQATQILGANFLLRQRVPALLPNDYVVLTLTYPLSEALKPYGSLLAILVIISLLGVTAVSAVSWYVAGLMTRPISALTNATRRLREGEVVDVTVNTHDELADLAVDFNHMSAEIKKREEEIRKSAVTNADTSLPNRLALEEYLLSEEICPNTSYVVSININRFSEIRGTIGFEAASALLKSAAENLSNTPEIRFLAVVAEGLLAALVQVSPGTDVRKLLQSVKDTAETMFLIDDSCADIMFSIGICPFDEEDRLSAIKHSNIAVEQAIALNEDIQFFDDEKYDQIRGNLSLMGDLVRALDTGDIGVAFQPKYDLKSNTAVGVEALVRWHDPVRGQVFPDVFIPLAEETGHIEALTKYVLQKSLEAQIELRNAGYDLCMSINLSGRLVGSDRFIKAAISILEPHVGDVCFEITETAVIEDPKRGISNINKLVDAGVLISIDDYGSGLSSLAYLKQIPASELKIDKSFVLDIGRDQRDALLVVSTVNLAHSLGMKVTAEGVETEATATLLTNIGCDIGQGYGLGRPMFLEDLIPFLDQQNDQASPERRDVG